MLCERSTRSQLEVVCHVSFGHFFLLGAICDLNPDYCACACLLLTGTVMVLIAFKDHWVWGHMIVWDTWWGHPFRLISPSCHVCHTALCFPVFLLGSDEEERTYGRGFFLGCKTQAEGVTYLLWIDLIIMIITETILERLAEQHSCRRGYFERTKDR